MLEQLATLKAIDKHFYKVTFVILWISLSLLCIPFFIFVQGLMLENTFSETANKLIIYEPREHKINPPSETKLSYLSKQLNTLKEIYPKVKALCTAPAIHKQKQEVLGSVLDFKEALFTLKKSLEEKAAVLAIAFPEEYGLQEYETQLPRNEDLSQLFIYMDMVDFYMTLLLEMPAEKITYLRFADVMERPFSTHDAEYYSIFTTEIAFECSYIAVIRFLTTVAQAKEINSIESISIKQSQSKDAEEGDLEVIVKIATFSIL